MNASDVVEAFLTENEIPFASPAPGAWVFALAGSVKLHVPLSLTLTATGLRIESFFMRAPQEHHEELFRLLLSYHARSRACRFALDSEGDVFIVAHASDVSALELDRIIGEILTTADQMFTPALELGFAAYLAADMAWRAKQPPGPSA